MNKLEFTFFFQKDILSQYRLYEESKEATFFHTQQWRAILSSTFPKWQPLTLVILYSDGNIALLPMLRRYSFYPFRYTESMLPGVYGGPLFLYPPTVEHWNAFWDTVNKMQDFVIYGNPFLLFQGEHRCERRLMYTHVLDLRVGYEQLWKNFRKGHRANIRSARKRGVEVRQASTIGEVDAYYAVYEDSLKRWGKAASGFYPRKLFYNIFTHPLYGKNIKLWVAYKDEKIVAGAIMFYHNDHVVYWHGAVHSNYMTYHPVHLLLDIAIRDACNLSFRWFDFNPSGGLRGVEFFKDGFGAQLKYFYVYRFLTPLGKAYRYYRYLKERTLKTCAL